MFQGITQWHYRTSTPVFRRFAIAVLAAIIVILTASPSMGQAKVTRMDNGMQLTDFLVRLQSKHRTGPATQRRMVETEMSSVALRRQDVMSELIKKNPDAFLQLAVPEAFRRSLPPGVARFVEEEVEVVGTYKARYVELEGDEHVEHLLESESGRYTLHFAGPEPEEMDTGTRLRARGMGLGNALALNGDSGSLGRLAAAPPPNTLGEQKTLVMLINFQDNTGQPYTLDYARKVVFETTSDYYREVTGNKTWLTGEVQGWFTIPMSSSVCNPDQLAYYAKQAASAAGANLNQYTRYIYGFPGNACGWWGLGDIGGKPSESWVKGSFTLKVVGHELGHNFGAYHSRTSSSEYGDTLDIMGNPSSGHVNAFHKERLGWLNYGTAAPITTVSASGDYYLDAFSSPTTNPKALKILKSTDSSGRKTWYYVEHRRNIGFDSFLSSNANVLNGVVVRTGAESSPDSSYLLDMTPETSTWSDPALTVGSSFHDAAAGLTITAISAGPTGATVTVSLTPKPCVPAKPLISVSPSSKWGMAGSRLDYTVSVTNKDGDGCGATNFNLNSVAPGGWSAVYDSPVLSIAPNGTAGTKLWVTSPGSVGDGLFNVEARVSKASEPTSSASSNATYVVSSALNVTVSTDQTSYAPNQWVTVSVRVSAGSTPTSASVRLYLTKADGKQSAYTGSADSDGLATIRFKLNKKDPAGPYMISVEATNGDGTLGTAQGGFAVK